MNPAAETPNNHLADMSRRRFLAQAGAATAAAALSAAPALADGSTDAPPQPPLPPLPLPPLADQTERENLAAPTAAPPEGRVGIAIVGLGRLSLEQILPAFGSAKRCRPVALVSGERAKALQVAHQYGIKETSVYDYQSFDKIASNPEIEAVYIVLPNSMHHEFTLRAAKAGKHVLCEKPMANSVKECEEMVEACEKANRKLMIAYRIQYEPNNNFARQMLQTGELGKIKLIDLHNGQAQGGDLNQWRLKEALAGGGSLPDVGLYCLNTVRFLTGEEPFEISGATVYSTPNDTRFKEVEETVMWTMQFPSGILATCSTSYGYHENRRYGIFGSAARVDMNPAFSYNGLEMTVTRKSPRDPMAESVERMKREEKNQFALEMDHFAQCVTENKTPWTPGEEGVQDQKLMEAIYQSAREKKPVALPRIVKRDAFRGTPPSTKAYPDRSFANGSRRVSSKWKTFV